jgi:hypothetical protein
MNNFFRINQDNINKFLLEDYFTKNKILNLNLFQILNYNLNQNNINNSNKILWEYGKSNIKINNFNKVISKNLAILNHIDSIFIDFITHNHNIKLLNISQNPQIFFSNEKGNLFFYNNSFVFNLLKKNLCGYYSVNECGYFIISDFENNDLKYLCKNVSNNNDNNNINYNNYINFINTIKNLFLKNKIISESNSTCSRNLNKILTYILNNLPNDKLIDNIYFKSIPNYSFIIKMYSEHFNILFVDNDNHLIYYINCFKYSNSQCCFMFFYVLDIDSNLKIKHIKYSLNANNLLL